MELMLQRLAISSRRGLESGLWIIPHVQQIVPSGKLREVVFKECSGFKGCCLHAAAGTESENRPGVIPTSGY